MKFSFRDVQIDGLLVVLPQRESRFDDEIPNYNFPVPNSQKLKQVIGIDRHRVVDPETCASDLAVHGLQYLLDRRLLQADRIDGLVLVTETPDYFMPPTSNVIQGKLGLRPDVWCLDMNQGCAGFVVGLIQAFLMLQQPTVREVVLVNADTLTRTCSPHDRNAYPLLGDAASVAVLRRSERPSLVPANLKMDGTQHQAIMIPAGGFRIPKSAATAIEHTSEDGNSRSQEHYHMDGIAVLQFVMTQIPPLIDELLADAGRTKESIDWYMFHQPNRFMLQKLADKLQVPRNRVPSDIVEKYGNASSVTVPTAIVHTLGSRLVQERFSMCLCGFGVGLTWSSMLLDVGPLAFCEMIEYPTPQREPACG